MVTISVAGQQWGVERKDKYTATVRGPGYEATHKYSPSLGFHELGAGEDATALCAAAGSEDAALAVVDALTEAFRAAESAAFHASRRAAK